MMPLLPAAGLSTNSVGPQSSDLPHLSSDKRSVENNSAFVSNKFRLQYTCNVCDTRNSHLVSRLAYREGLVVAICKGCNSKHLIADNLDGNAGFGGTRNIEEYFSELGNDLVTRVTPEVFDLEEILFFDSASGALAGEGGDPVLE